MSKENDSIRLHFFLKKGKNRRLSSTVYHAMLLLIAATSTEVEADRVWDKRCLDAFLFWKAVKDTSTSAEGVVFRSKTVCTSFDAAGASLEAATLFRHQMCTCNWQTPSERSWLRMWRDPTPRPKTLLIFQFKHRRKATPATTALQMSSVFLERNFHENCFVE